MAENIYNDEDPDTPANELEQQTSWISHTVFYKTLIQIQKYGELPKVLVADPLPIKDTYLGGMAYDLPAMINFCFKIGSLALAIWPPVVDGIVRHLCEAMAN